jgi:hypothetical protein
VDIPDDWWIETGMHVFHRTTPTYRAEASCGNRIATVHFSEVVPPIRNPDVRWFDRERMVRILYGFSNNFALPPIEVHELPDQCSGKYGVRDGFHRFYASAAAGFDHLPVVIFPFLVPRCLAWVETLSRR